MKPNRFHSQHLRTDLWRLRFLECVVDWSWPLLWHLPPPRHFQIGLGLALVCRGGGHVVVVAGAVVERCRLRLERLHNQDKRSPPVRRRSRSRSRPNPNGRYWQICLAISVVAATT